MQQILALIVPLFAVIVIGHLASRRRLMEPPGIGALNAFAYWIALPCLLFAAMAKVQVGGLLGVSLIYLGCCIAVYTFAMAVSALVFKRSLAEAAMYGLNSTYGNVIYFGIPLVTAAFDARSLPVILAIVAVHSGVLLPLTAALIEVSTQQAANLRATGRRMALGLVRNPVVMSILAGFAWQHAGLAVPMPLDNLLAMLGSAAAPLALFCLGASLPTAAGALLRGSEVIVGALIKLTVLPALIGIVAWKVGIDDLAWKVAVLTAAVPTGTNAILLARSGKILPEVSAAIVVLATAASVLTITGLLYWMR